MSLHQAEEFLHNKGNRQQNEKTESQSIFTNDTPDKGLISQIYKELTQHRSPHTLQLKSGQET